MTSRSSRPGTARETNAPPPPRPGAPLWLDLLGVLLLWELLAFWLGQGRLVFAYDVFRDMAYAHGIARGRLWSDPALPGLAAWYPPGNPLVMATVAKLTHATIAGVYGTSLYWLQWLLPVLLHLLVRAGFGRGTAWLALPVVFLGSLWWTTQIAMPMPSVQELAWTFAALLVWTRARGWRGAVAAGLLAAGGIWSHVLDGAFATGIILLHGVAGLFVPGEEAAGERRARAGRAVLAALVAAIFASPVLVRQIGLSRVNQAPHHWFAPELHRLPFALQTHVPLVPLLGLVGLVAAARRWPRQGWLVAWFALAAAGELAGYLAHDLKWPLPWLIPHEFQWHRQLALCVAAAGSIAALATRISSLRAPRSRRRAEEGAPLTTLGWVAGIAALAIAVGPGVPQLAKADAYLMRADERWSGVLDLKAWVESHTGPDDVLVSDPEASYFLSGLTGRPVVALPLGHMNPAIDPRPRLEDVRVMLTTGDEREFLVRARRYRGAWLLVRWDAQIADSLRRRFAGWPALEPARVGDSEMWVYRIAPAR